MPILKKLFKRKNSIQQKRDTTGFLRDAGAKSCGVYPLSRGSFLEFAAGNYAGISGFENLTAYEAMRFYRSTSAVASAVDMRTDEIEQLKIVLESPNGDMTDNHPILQYLKKPNDFETKTSFIRQLSNNLLITGNMYIYAAGNVKRPPIETYAIKPQAVSVLEGLNRYPDRFEVVEGPGKGSFVIERVPKLGARYYDDNLMELYQYREFSSSDRTVFGDSPLLAVALEVMQHIRGRYHNLALLNNGGRLSLVVMFKDGMDNDTHRERKQEIQEQWAGPQNAGSIAVISGEEYDIKEFGTTNKDMDFAELERTVSHAIYTRYKIPLPLISTDASTYNNYQTARESLYDNAVLPTAQVLFDSIGNMLLPRYGLDPMEYRLTYDIESIPALTQRRLDQLKTRKEINIETTNELRATMPNKEPIENGDILYQNASLVPIGTSTEVEPEEITEDDINEMVEDATD